MSVNNDTVGCDPPFVIHLFCSAVNKGAASSRLSIIHFPVFLWKFLCSFGNCPLTNGLENAKMSTFHAAVVE